MNDFHLENVLLGENNDVAGMHSLIKFVSSFSR